MDFNIKWEIVKKMKPFAPGEKVCKLCLQEILSILRSNPSLNKKKRKKFLDIVAQEAIPAKHTNNLLLSDEGPIMDPKL